MNKQSDSSTPLTEALSRLRDLVTCDGIDKALAARAQEEAK